VPVATPGTRDIIQSRFESTPKRKKKKKHIGHVTYSDADNVSNVRRESKIIPQTSRLKDSALGTENCLLL
jgi:hypothetical protein